VTERASRPWVWVRIGTLVAATAVLILLLRTVNWPAAIDAVRHASAGWLALSVLGNTAVLVCWAAFWRALVPGDEPPVAYSRMLEIASGASALMNTLPIGFGHASCIPLLARRAALSSRGAISVLALDQLGEGIVKVSIYLSVALLVPLPTWMRAGVATACIGVAIWFVVMAVASRWAGELAILRDWRRSLTALGLVSAMKAVQLAAIVAAQRAFGVHVGVPGSLLVLATILLASMIPGAPGNLGTYEAVVFVAYRHLGIAPSHAVSLAIVQHVSFLIPAVAPGYLAFGSRALSRSAMASR
jgi:hypothetical protein